MDERKARRYDNSGDGEAQYFSADEVEEIREQVKQRVKDEYRTEIAKQLNDVDDLTQSDIGEIFGISHSRVSQIVNSDD
jgi:DNA-directed RNA polymerase specialized sigma subunit